MRRPVEPAEILTYGTVAGLLAADVVLHRGHRMVVTDVARRHPVFVLVTGLHLLGLLPRWADPYTWAARLIRQR